MAGPGRPKKKSSQAEQLLAALGFVDVATGNDEWSEYVALGGNYCVAFNGQIAAGYPITEELTLCPHLDKLEAALARCGKSLAIAETPTGNLSIKGDNLRAVVPCFVGARPTVTPDAPIAAVDDRLKAAFKACGALATEAATEVLGASLLLEANQCTAINPGRSSILQFWHGIDLPPATVVPKIFAAAVAKATMALTGIGLTWSNQLGAASSITLWFDGGAWIKTQCYNDRWPPFSHLFDQQAFPVEVPANFFEAVEAVSNFNEHGTVYLVENGVQSHAETEVGAQFEVKGLQGGKKFDAELIGQVAPWVKAIDLTTFPDRLYYTGGEAATPIRGLVMSLNSATEGGET